MSIKQVNLNQLVIDETINPRRAINRINIWTNLSRNDINCTNYSFN
ncbi:hypothetical protein MHK_005104 [Candidatus Magnetomorum sp. HK-1]|nr:hypothetical protein MHK_005104 [Candidatus Magnetomorum sp. HK-1]